VSCRNCSARSRGCPGGTALVLAYALAFGCMGPSPCDGCPVSGIDIVAFLNMLMDPICDHQNEVLKYFPVPLFNLLIFNGDLC
jgi:hypothetical protein